MRSMSVRVVGVVLVVCGWLVCTSWAAEPEMVDNPVYQAWAKHKVGTTVTYKQQVYRGSPTTQSAERTARRMSSMVLTKKLTDLTPEKAVLDRSMQLKIGRGMMNQPLGNETIPAKIQKGQEGLPPEASPQRFEVSDQKEGQDQVSVGGKQYEAKWTQYTVHESRNGAASGQIKVWTSPDVPGGLLKIDSEITNAPDEPPISTELTLDSFQEG